MDLGYYMGIARRNLKKFKTGKRFITSALFDEKEWLALEHSEKVDFGKHFSNEVSQGKVKGVKCFNENSRAQRRYVYQE
jgi:hypothetical protein